MAEGNGHAGTKSCRPSVARFRTSSRQAHSSRDKEIDEADATGESTVGVVVIEVSCSRG